MFKYKFIGSHAVPGGWDCLIELSAVARSAQVVVKMIFGEGPTLKTNILFANTINGKPI